MKQEVKDFLKNMALAVVGIATNKIKILDAREKHRRLKICKSCKFFNPEKYQCRVCSCKGRMLKLKASVNLWKCPEGKWEQANIEHDLGNCSVCQGFLEKIEKNGHKTFATCVNGCTVEM